MPTNGTNAITNDKLLTTEEGTAAVVAPLPAGTSNLPNDELSTTEEGTAMVVVTMPGNDTIWPTDDVLSTTKEGTPVKGYSELSTTVQGTELPSSQVSESTTTQH
jgi:hypothetical protein